MKALSLVVLLVTVLLSSGCAVNRELIAKTSVSLRQDIFQEVQTPQLAPGNSLLKVDFTVKNFKSRFFNNYVKHTDPPYTVVMNIDGQAVVLTDEPILEDLPGRFNDNPEAGIGWRYNFKKMLLLSPGKHHVSIALPLSDAFIEKELDLKEGENEIKLIPTYISGIKRYPKFPRFSKGISIIKVRLNNQEI